MLALAAITSTTEAEGPNLRPPAEEKADLQFTAGAAGEGEEGGDGADAAEEESESGASRVCTFQSRGL